MQPLRTMVIGIAFSAMAFISPLAAAHAVLKNSSPAADTTITGSPTEIVLTFNEPVEASFSKISLIGADGKEIRIAKNTVDENDASVLRSQLPALGKGEYSVKWAGVGHDGHRRTGNFKFTVK